MAATALCYLAAWGPFCVLCLWEMVVMPQVKSSTHNYIILSSNKCVLSQGDPGSISAGGLLICQDIHSRQSFHLLLHVQGLSQGHMVCLQQVVCLFLKSFSRLVSPLKKAEVRVKRKENFEEEFWAEETDNGDVGADDNCTCGHQPHLLVN